MCLKTKKGAYRSKHDKVVWTVKMVNKDGTVCSKYNNFTWLLDVVHKAEGIDIIDSIGRVGEGFFHSFTKRIDALASDALCYITNRSCNSKLTVFKAIIPKGTLYYIGRIPNHYYDAGKKSIASRYLRLVKHVARKER